MKRGYRRGSLLFAGLLFAFQTHIMAGNHVVAAVDSTRTAVADTVKKAGKKIPAIAEFIKPGAQSFPGMFTVYAQDDRYYVEVPDALLGRDIFVMVSLVQGSAQQTRGERDMLGYAGDALFSRLVRFERGPKDKLFLKEPVYTTVMPDPSSDLYGAVSASGMMPIAVGFDVKARGEHSVLVDFTDTYTSDHQYFSLKGAKEMMNIGSYQSDRSYPTTVSAFRDNVIFRSVKS